MQSLTSARADQLLRLLDVYGYPKASSKILDFGCGLGRLVAELTERGIDAYGCDFVQELGEPNDRTRAIEQPYRLPFGDAMFDCVVSDQVFEHVQDYRLALAEIDRVLRPGGVTVHLFPPRHMWREPHVFVPLATVVQTRWWLLLWAHLGVRNRFQRGTPAREVARLNHVYLRERTTYYTRKRILAESRTVFPTAWLADTESLESRLGTKAQMLARAARHAPILARAYGNLRERVLIARKLEAEGLRPFDVQHPDSPSTLRA